MTEQREDYHVETTNIDHSRSIETFTQLSVPVLAEALEMDDSRGFPLTSIKQAYVLERLNQTFGLLGYGWRYSYAPHHIETAGGKEEVLVELALQWRISEQPQENASPPIYWHRLHDGRNTWRFDTRLPSVWSEPVFSTGGCSANRKGSLPLKDAYQGAVTNAITKAASRLGVGLDVFKGQEEPPPPEPRKAKAAKQSKAPTPRKASPEPSRRASPEPSQGEQKANAEIPTLASMQKAAQAEANKLKVEGAAEAKIVQALAHKMSQVGLKMQTARLLFALLGEGEFSQQRVMGVYNYLLSARLSEEQVALLNAAAWEGFPEPASNQNPDRSEGSIDG